MLLYLHPIHDVLHMGQLEVYCLSSVSKNPLVHLFYQLPSHFLVSYTVFIFFIPFSVILTYAYLEFYFCYFPFLLLFLRNFPSV